MGYIDHARGRYEVKVHGLPPPWEWEYRRLLGQKYGVKLHAVAGCVVLLDVGMYADGYNSVSERLLAGKYGKDIFAECAGLAQQTWEENGQADHPGQ